MSEINVRSEAVDVEQIMRQIRARVREKQGSAYTEAELQQLAGAKLDSLLDPGGTRSKLVKEFRARVTAGSVTDFSEAALYDSHRGWLKSARRMLNPVLKLFINPIAFSRAMQARHEIDALIYEVVQQLVVELTRSSLEVQNLKMKVESLSTRFDFDVRRAKAFEGVAPSRPVSQDRPRQHTPHQQQGGGRGQGGFQGSGGSGGSSGSGGSGGSGGSAGSGGSGSGWSPAGSSGSASTSGPAVPASLASQPNQLSVSQPIQTPAGQQFSAPSTAPSAAPIPAPGQVQGGSGSPDSQGNMGPNDPRRRRRRRRRRRPGQGPQGQGNQGNQGTPGSHTGPQGTTGAAGTEGSNAGHAAQGPADAGGDWDDADDGASDQ